MNRDPVRHEVHHYCTIPASTLARRATSRQGANNRLAPSSLGVDPAHSPLSCFKKVVQFDVPRRPQTTRLTVRWVWLHILIVITQSLVHGHLQCNAQAIMMHVRRVAMNNLSSMHSLRSSWQSHAWPHCHNSGQRTHTCTPLTVAGSFHRYSHLEAWCAMGQPQDCTHLQGVHLCQTWEAPRW